MLKGFRDFIMRGNVVDMAVGLVIGAAFTALVTGFVKAFLTPLIGLATSSVGDFNNKKITVMDTEFPVGAFLSAIIAFVLTAAVLYFLVVLPMNHMRDKLTKKPEPTAKEILRDCPECLTEIPTVATRCSACTAVVDPVPPEGEEAAAAVPAPSKSV